MLKVSSDGTVYAWAVYEPDYRNETERLFRHKLATIQGIERGHYDFPKTGRIPWRPEEQFYLERMKTLAT